MYIKGDIDIVHYRVLVKALCNVIPMLAGENPLESIQNKTIVVQWKNARSRSFNRLFI